MIPVESDESALRWPTGHDAAAPPATATADVLGAAFRQGNTVVSLARKAMEEHFPRDPDYDPLPDIRGTRYFDQHKNNFLDSGSQAETRAIMARIDAEEEDRRILDAAGWGGFVAQVAAGTLDPTIALPAGTLYRAARGGYALARSGLSVAGAAATQAAAQEAILLSTHETRSLLESGTAIGSSAILGGLIGVGAAKLLTNSERSAMVAALDEARTKLNAHLDPAPSAPAKTAGGPLDEATTAASQAANANAEPAPGLRAAVGAAATDMRELSPVPYGLDSVPVIGKAVAKLFPTLRALEEGDVVTRRAVAELAEIPIRVEENLSGGTTTLRGGPAIDRETRMIREGLTAQMGDELTRLYADYRFNQPDKKFPRARDALARWRGEAAEGKLSFDQFDAAIYDALSQGDRHVVPQVAEAAQWIRRNILDPIASRAESAIEGFKKIEPKEGESYAPRMWNRELIQARWGEFVEMWTERLSADQATKAATKQRLDWLNAQLGSWSGQAKKFEARLARLDQRGLELGARLDERAMEVRRGDKRKGALQERASSIAEEVSAIEEFVAAMRAEVKDPALLQRLDALEREAAQLRRADKPVTEAQLRRLEQEELRGVLAGPQRLAAEMLVGRRAWPKAPSFISWIVANGGLKDTGGDVASILGGKNLRPGLINARGMQLDELAEKIQGEFGGHFPHAEEPGGGAPSHTDVLGWIDDALRGREPSFWVESFSQADQAKLEAARIAAAMDEALSRAGVDVKSAADVAKILRDGRAQGVTIADLDRIAADMEAAGQAIPVTLRRADVEDQLIVTRETIAELRGLIAKARAAAEKKTQSLRVADARTSEAGLAERASRGRLGVIEDQLSRADLKRELLADAIEIAGRERDAIRATIEAELAAWEGKSAIEAKSALKAREKYAAETGRAPDSPRLASVDDAVDRAVKRILASDRDLSRQELCALAEEIAWRHIGTPEGRLPYDADAGGPIIGVPQQGADLRGHAAHRVVNLPYELAAPWLDRSATRAVRSYMHSVLPDALIAERFGGDPNMLNVFKEIEDAYSARLSAAKSKAESQRLIAQSAADMKIVAGVRDRIRGVFGYDPQMRNLARVSQAALKINNIVSSHMMAVSSLPDFAGVVFRHGLESAFGDGWRPFLSAMMDAKTWEAWKKHGAEWRAFGIGAETQLAARQHAIDDIHEMYRPASRFERALSWANDKAFVVNLLAPLTDLQKRIAANVASHNILRAAKNVAEGELGSTAAKQTALLGESNISPQLASAIWKEFKNAGGAEVNGVLLPNLADWTNEEARRAFAGAVARDVEIAVMTPGQEKPLWFSRPGFNLLAQFKSFMAAATVRIMIANLQRADAAALQGALFSVGLGMLSYRINAMASGKPTSERPQDWIKEGVNRSGLLGWFEEGNGVMSKATNGGVDVYRLIGADRPASKWVDRAAAALFLGPTYGKVQNIYRVLSPATGRREWTEGDTHALRMALLGSNLPYLPRLFDQVERRANAAFGIEMKSPH